MADLSKAWDLTIGVFLISPMAENRRRLLDLTTPVPFRPVELMSMRNFVEASATKVFDCVAAGVRDVVHTAVQCIAEQP